MSGTIRRLSAGITDGAARPTRKIAAGTTFSATTSFSHRFQGSVGSVARSLRSLSRVITRPVYGKP